jgi:hypothetical protein
LDVTRSCGHRAGHALRIDRLLVASDHFAVQ